MKKWQWNGKKRSEPNESTFENWSLSCGITTNSKEDCCRSYRSRGLSSKDRFTTRLDERTIGLCCWQQSEKWVFLKVFLLGTSQCFSVGSFCQSRDPALNFCDSRYLGLEAPRLCDWNMARSFVKNIHLYTPYSKTLSNTLLLEKYVSGRAQFEFDFRCWRKTATDGRFSQSWFFSAFGAFITPLCPRAISCQCYRRQGLLVFSIVIYSRVRISHSYVTTTSYYY